MTSIYRAAVRAFPGPGEAVLLVVAVLVLQTGCGVLLGIALALSGKMDAAGLAALVIPPGALLAMNLLAFGATGAWAGWATRARWREVLLGGRAGAGPWLAAVPLLLGTTVLVSESCNLLQLAWPFAPPKVDIFSALMDVAKHPVASVLTVVVLAPVAEEYLLRGVILRGLLEHLRPWPAVWLTTALFTGMHANLWQVPVGLGLGLVCGWAYLRTRSLGLCIFLHFLNNALALFARYLPFRVPGWNDVTPGPELQPWWLDVAAVALLGLGWWLFAQTTKGLLRPPPLPESELPPELPPVLPLPEEPATAEAAVPSAPVVNVDEQAAPP